MSIKNIIKKYEDIALSDKEVLKLVDGKCNVILYPDLHKYQSIDQVLDPYGSCLLLFAAQVKPNYYGHWCCINRVENNNNKIEFFNPYGGYPDDSLNYISGEIRRESNQDLPYLSELLLKSPYDLSYNQYKFQKHSDHIKSCGRWCALRILLKNLSLIEFNNLIKKLTKKFKLTNDQLVTILTMYIN